MEIREDDIISWWRAKAQGFRGLYIPGINAGVSEKSNFEQYVWNYNE